MLSGGEPIPLKPNVFDTLLVLVENSGRTVDKGELMQLIWPDEIAEENNLTQNISAIRKCLGGRHTEHRYVVTVPGAATASWQTYKKHRGKSLPRPASGLQNLKRFGLLIRKARLRSQALKLQFPMWGGDRIWSHILPSHSRALNATGQWPC